MSDRPPRTLMASVQSLQAVSPPRGSGTSVTAPIYISTPLVTTPMVESLASHPHSQAVDNVPGIELLTLVMNMNENYEDCRYANLTDGDKLATGHGQKGVVRVMKPEDMPYFYSQDGCAYTPDVVLSISGS